MPSIRKAGVHVSGATDINFIEGSNVTLTITEEQSQEAGTGGDDPRTARANEVTVEIAASASQPGSGGFALDTGGNVI